MLTPILIISFHLIGNGWCQFNQEAFQQLMVNHLQQVPVDKWGNPLPPAEKKNKDEDEEGEKEKEKDSGKVKAMAVTTLDLTTSLSVTNSDANTFSGSVANFNNGKSSTGSASSSTTSSSPTSVQAVAQNDVIGQTFRGPIVYPVNTTSIPIGGLFPLTIDGVPNLYGVQFAEFFKCAINLANSNSRILPNTLLTYFVQDIGAAPAESISQSLLLARRGVPAIVGPAYDEQVLAVNSIVAGEIIPFNSYGASAVQLSNGTTYPSFFRTITDDIFQARAMAETCRLFGWDFVAALFTTDFYGQSGRTSFLNQAGRNRIKVTCVNQIDPGSTRGLQTFASCISQSEASVVLLWMGPEDAANALSFLYINSTINDRLTFLASDQWALIKDPQAFNDTRPRTGLSFPLSFIEGKSKCTITS